MNHLHSYCSNVLRLFIVQDQHVCGTRVHVYRTELTCTHYRIYMPVRQVPDEQCVVLYSGTSL